MLGVANGCTGRIVCVSIGYSYLVSLTIMLFKLQELRELTKLEAEGHGTSFNVRKKELDLGMTKSSQAELGRPKTRINKLLYESAKLHGTKLSELYL